MGQLAASQTAEVRPKLGQPFFSTKENGTGLGLMVSQRIIADYAGEMQIHSHEGLGTTVSVRFPVSRAAPQSSCDAALL